MGKPQNSREYARLKAEEEKKAARPFVARPALPRLADFPPVAISMAEKLSAWVADAGLRKVVMLAMCVYWEGHTGVPPIQRPGAEEYEAFKLLLKLSLAPNCLPCGKCGWPRAQGYRCHACGDTAKEED